METLTSTIIYSSKEAELFEGPIFDPTNKLLYFVSILDGLVYCYSPISNEILSIKLDSPTSNVYLTESKKVVIIASKNGFFEANFNCLETSFKFQIDIADNVRYNDGIQDPIGRLIIGTMGYPDVEKGLGKVYSYHNGNCKIIIDHTTISNGLAFSHDNRFMYFIDTPTKQIAKYKYDIETGSVNFVSNVVEFTEKGSPDGMAIDKNGMLWVAEWGGSCVSQWNPNTGKKINEIKLPHSNVTSCCFDENENLFITAANDPSDNELRGSALYYLNLNKSNQ
ncbi:SMP-30/gluconolactonase/LRE family protein [Winogradskyella vincentii]|uniref:SMP-30/gluconolactonase/LRE family protein n=1 Tax=Winogradskyella vincentii TaxID=2877122 RepID=A0ABS7XYQ8_9FLAO|nr:SMP-30/gluconolactonase/LRE family protein [Winogradskyella vincentii]MCA0152797.1 SMP-30/gluconolactonase/LRE family protein [Winogradskyella vincentii]